MPPVLDAKTKAKSSVYGPVHSWRVGSSLGVDLLLQTSICSFNCIYCQLGDIQQKTIERQIYVTTDQIERDFKESAWQEVDIVTLSGSGEPTLALNIGEVIHFIKEYAKKPVMVLTNGTLLYEPAVQRDLMEADTVAVKLDAATDTGLKQMNRPVPGVSLEGPQGIIAGIQAFKKVYPGKLCIQSMFMPTNLSEVEAMAELFNQIQPDEVQLNTPKRPYPRAWVLESRGNHPAKKSEQTGEHPACETTIEEPVNVQTQTLKTISEEEAVSLEELIRTKTGGKIPILSVYHS